MAMIFDFGRFKKAKPSSGITWESRYAGVLSVAIVDNVPIAGISGPWPDGNYALTWWPTHDQGSAPSLEFHTTLMMARRRVEASSKHPSQSARLA